MHHVGGIHAGAALAGTAWLCAFAWRGDRCPRAASRERLHHDPRARLLPRRAGLIVVVCAAPVVRSRAHNVFEMTHRFGGWTAIALFWALTARRRARRPGRSVCWRPDGERRLALAAAAARPGDGRAARPRTPPSSTSTTASRRRSRRPSGSAAARCASGTRSRPWPRPGAAGYRVLISRAGDWTGRFIDDPPSHVWVRGTPVAAPMAKVALLYERVVYVVTGSGIGPCLGQILADARPRAARVVHARSAGHLRRRARRRGPAPHSPMPSSGTRRERGKPDLVAARAPRPIADFDAEAVFVVSNKATTLRLVHALERPASRPSGRSGTPERNLRRAAGFLRHAGDACCLWSSRWCSSPPRPRPPRRSSRRATSPPPSRSARDGRAFVVSPSARPDSGTLSAVRRRSALAGRGVRARRGR